MTLTDKRRVLVIGGGTFVGDNVAAALLAEGAEITLLVRPGAEDRLGALANRVRWAVADPWDPASLRGRARGHGVVVNTIGSMIADPRRGLTHHRLNVVSARNIAAMCVSDGVPRLVLLSAARAPWVSRSYLRSKREAEAYLKRVGVRGTVIRAPLVYVRRQQRSPFFTWMSWAGGLPPLSWLGLRNIAPMPVDVLARGVARIALSDGFNRPLYFASDLRRLNNREERRNRLPPPPVMPLTPPTADAAGPAGEPVTDLTPPSNPLAFVDEDAPFGWTPPPLDDDEVDR